MHKCVYFPLCHNKKTPGKFHPWSLIFAQLVFIKPIDKIILPYLEFACKYFLYIICFKYSVYDYNLRKKKTAKVVLFSANVSLKTRVSKLINIIALQTGMVIFAITGSLFQSSFVVKFLQQNKRNEV